MKDSNSAMLLINDMFRVITDIGLSLFYLQILSYYRINHERFLLETNGKVMRMRSNLLMITESYVNRGCSLTAQSLPP